MTAEVEIDTTPVNDVDLIESVQDRIGGLHPAERRVADFVLMNSRRVISMNLGAFAQEAGVSEPTAIRFCRSVGCVGYSDLKIQLAQSVAIARTGVMAALMPGDSLAVLADKAFGTAADRLRRQRAALDLATLERAIEILSDARRITIAANGTAMPAARDAERCLLGLGLPGALHSEMQLQRVAASGLGRSDVLLALQLDEDSAHVMNCADLARKGGAVVLSIANEGSVIAMAADISIPLLASTPGDPFTPDPARLLCQVTTSLLATAVSLRGGEMAAARITRVMTAMAAPGQNLEE